MEKQRSMDSAILPDSKEQKSPGVLSFLRDRTLSLALTVLLSGTISGCGDSKEEIQARQNKANSCLKKLTKREVGQAQRDCSSDTFLLNRLRSCENRLSNLDSESYNNIERNIGSYCKQGAISPDAENQVAAMEKLNELRDSFKQAKMETCGGEKASDCEKVTNDKAAKLRTIISLNSDGFYDLSSYEDIDEGIILAGELEDFKTAEILLIYKRKLPQDKNWRAHAEDYK